MKTTCPSCGRTFPIRAEHIGKKGKCPKCGERFVVDEDAAEAIIVPDDPPRPSPVPPQMPRTDVRANVAPSGTSLTRNQWLLLSAIPISAILCCIGIPLFMQGAPPAARTPPAQPTQKASAPAITEHELVEPEPVAQVEEQQYIVLATDNVPITESPDPQSEIVATGRKGDIFELYEATPGWFAISVNAGVSRYVPDSVATLTDDRPILPELLERRREVYIAVGKAQHRAHREADQKYPISATSDSSMIDKNTHFQAVLADRFVLEVAHDLDIQTPIVGEIIMEGATAMQRPLGDPERNAWEYYEEAEREWQQKEGEETRLLIAERYYKAWDTERQRMVSNGREYGIERNPTPSTDKLYFDKDSLPWKIDTSVGAAGYVHQLRVVQILDDRTALVMFGDKIAMAVGWGTSDLVDGDAFAPEDAVVITGVKEYTTVLGAKSRVHVIEPFNLKKYETQFIPE
ncbi:MAG: MJ0042-type zinc finger domain-containing protein [Planctomycetaceae bacterium]